MQDRFISGSQKSDDFSRACPHKNQDAENGMRCRNKFGMTLFSMTNLKYVAVRFIAQILPVSSPLKVEERGEGRVWEVAPAVRFIQIF